VTASRSAPFSCNATHTGSVSELTLVALCMHIPNISSLQGLQWALYATMLHVRALVARRPDMLFRPLRES
jgi:hypothetical protein